MPSFAFSTKIQSPSGHEPGLNLHVQHVLVAGSPSQSIRRIKQRVPHDLDVLLESDLVLTLVGFVNHVKVSNGDVVQSAISRHLLQFLQLNASQLGLDAVSAPHLDEYGTPTLILHAARRFSDRPTSQSPHLTLARIDLTYSFKTSSSLSLDSHSLLDVDAYFSRRLSLPVESVLNGVVTRFVVFQLVRRYPLIFGSWPKRLDLEMTFAATLIRSCLNIVMRSRDVQTRNKTKAYIKSLRKEQDAALSSSRKSLSRFLDGVDDLEPKTQLWNTTSLSDEEVLRFAVEMHLRTSTRPGPFKILKLGHLDSDDKESFNSVEEFALEETIDMCAISEDDLPYHSPSLTAESVVALSDDEEHWLDDHKLDRTPLSDAGSGADFYDLALDADCRSVSACQPDDDDLVSSQLELRTASELCRHNHLDIHAREDNLPSHGLPTISQPDISAREDHRLEGSEISQMSFDDAEWETYMCDPMSGVDHTSIAMCREGDDGLAFSALEPLTESELFPHLQLGVDSAAANSIDDFHRHYGAFLSEANFTSSRPLGHLEGHLPSHLVTHNVPAADPTCYDQGLDLDLDSDEEAGSDLEMIADDSEPLDAEHADSFLHDSSDDILSDMDTTSILQEDTHVSLAKAEHYWQRAGWDSSLMTLEEEGL